MLRNFDAPHLKPDGKPFKKVKIVNNEVVEGDEISIAQTLHNCLLMVPHGETVNGDAKFARSKLAAKLLKGGEQDYSIEELAMLKDLAGKNASVAEVYSLFNALDYEEKK